MTLRAIGYWVIYRSNFYKKISGLYCPNWDDGIHNLGAVQNW